MKQEKIKFLPIVFLAFTGVFISQIINLYNINGFVKIQNTALKEKIDKTNKDLIFLNRYDSGTDNTIEENYRQLREYIEKHADIKGIDYAVKVYNQGDYKPAADYVSAASVPGVKKMYVSIVLKVNKNYWQMGRLINELFQKFPLEFAPVNSGEKNNKGQPVSPALVYEVGNDIMEFNCIATLYGI